MNDRLHPMQQRGLFRAGGALACRVRAGFLRRQTLECPALSPDRFLFCTPPYWRCVQALDWRKRFDEHSVPVVGHRSPASCTPDRRPRWMTNYTANVYISYRVRVRGDLGLAANLHQQVRVNGARSAEATQYGFCATAQSLMSGIQCRPVLHSDCSSANFPLAMHTRRWSFTR